MYVSLCIHVRVHTPSSCTYLASTPGSLGGGEREPGTHCLSMRQNLRKHLRKTIRLLLTSTWFIYVYVVYQVQIRRLNKISARSSWLSVALEGLQSLQTNRNARKQPLHTSKRLCDPGKPTGSYITSSCSFFPKVSTSNRLWRPVTTQVVDAGCFHKGRYR